MEIERKFLCGDVDLSSCKHYEIEQFYISYEPEIRLRKKIGEKVEHYLTTKSKGNLVREEYETKIPLEIYECFKHLKIGNTITKTRYIKHLSDNLEAEIDIYNGHHSGLAVVEVEFKTEDDAIKFNPPAWFKEEITNLAEYKNSYLSKKEYH